jgi:hypothetical protein
LDSNPPLETVVDGALKNLFAACGVKLEPEGTPLPAARRSLTLVEEGRMEAKKIRQKDIRQLEKTLNELLARTLEQVPKLDGFKGF